MYQNIINAILNCLFVSLPEVLIWCVAVLILLKRNNLLDIYDWKYNIKQIMIPVIPVAISINLMRYILQFDNLVNFIVVEVMMCVLVIYMIKRNNFLNDKLNYVKIVMFVLLVDLFIIFLSEGMYALLVFSIFDLTLEYVNNNILINILLSIVPRTIQVLIIVFYIYKKNVNSKISLIENILKDKVLGLSITVFTLTTVLSTFIIMNFVLKENLFQEYLIALKVVLCVSITLIPLILIASYLTPIIHLINKNEKLYKSNTNIINNL